MDDAFGPIQWYDSDAVQRQFGTNLPHYEMLGAVYFVTFRLADSLPAEVCERLVSARDAFLQMHPLPHTEEQDRQFKRVYAGPLERYLDEGLGACVLRDRPVRQIVEEVLLRFDGKRYQVGDFVIMPNHVHLLMRVRRGLKLRGICRQWTNLSAARINRLRATSGRLWQSEPFDHIVRSPAKLEKCRQYIRDNPRNLPEGEYTLGRGSLFAEQCSQEDGV